MFLHGDDLCIASDINHSVVHRYNLPRTSNKKKQ
jgi:hypothetical protein